MHWWNELRKMSLPLQAMRKQQEGKHSGPRMTFSSELSAEALPTQKPLTSMQEAASHNDRRWNQYGCDFDLSCTFRVEKRNFPREELGLLVSASLPDLLPCPLLQHCFALCVSLCNTVHTLSVKTCVGTGKYMQLISVRGYLHLPAQCYCMYSTYTPRAGIQGKQVHATVVRLINIRWWSLSSLKHYLLDIILLTVIFFRIC